MPVNGVSSFNVVSPVTTGIDKLQKTEDKGASFSDFLKDAINKVSDLQMQSDKATEDFATGKTDNIHQVMIAAEKADVALQFTMQIRNKIMDAYNEIMRISI